MQPLENNDKVSVNKEEKDVYNELEVLNDEREPEDGGENEQVEGNDQQRE